MANGDCIIGAKLTERTENLEGRMKKLDGTLGRVFDKLDELKEGWQKRPSWTACIIITFLSSTTVGLLITLMKKI